MEERERMEQLGPYRYDRDPACFPLGRDSLELGEFATVKPGWRVCDLCSCCCSPPGPMG